MRKTKCRPHLLQSSWHPQTYYCIVDFNTIPLFTLRFRKVYSPKKTAEIGHNDLGLCDSTCVVLYIVWYEITPHKARVFVPF